eukprot:PLAT6989.1.p1 GENE.PLAT6989.1~~PLAT6989.1.p1  ORF type:complete len:202 (+),score=73.08 PLAT6989.1:82-687(+)
MKVLSIALTRVHDDVEDPVILASAEDVSEFGFFERSGAREMLTFLARTFTKRTPPGTRQAIEHEGHMCHCYTRRSGLSSIFVSDTDYPERVAFACLNNLMDAFTERYEEEVWAAETRDRALEFPDVEASLKSYQDPTEVDKIARIHKEIEDTKDVLHRTIDSVLERGERLDDLVERSDDLSKQSKMFYTTAKKHNRCCVVM